MAAVRPPAFVDRLRIPVIAAPMTAVSGLALAVAAADAGIGAGFPTHNAAPGAELDRWLGELEGRPGPAIPNLVVHRSNERLGRDLEVVVRRRVPAVITSVGSPRDVVAPLHDAGVSVLADVASMRHVDRAIEAGVDGLVLLCAGAGGQTGWANPLAFVRAVRARWDGLTILAGSVVDGASLLAALVAGCDLVSMGTPFIATAESAAALEYKRAVVDASIDDITLTDAVTGLPTNMIQSRSLPPDGAERASFDAAVVTGTRGDTEPSVAWFSAGHTAGGVREIVSVDALVGRLERELADAHRDLVTLNAGARSR